MDARNFTFLFYGFLAAWLILIVYVVVIATAKANSALRSNASAAWWKSARRSSR